MKNTLVWRRALLSAAIVVGNIGLAAPASAPLTTKKAVAVETTPEMLHTQLCANTPYTPKSDYQQTRGDIARRAATVLERTPHEELTRKLMAHESGYNPRVVSEAGAVGIGQLMKETADELGMRTASQQDLACLLARYAPYSLIPTHPQERLELAAKVVPLAILEQVDERFTVEQSAAGSNKYLRSLGLDDALHGRMRIYRVGNQTFQLIPTEEFVLEAYHAGIGNRLRGTRLGPVNKRYARSVQNVPLDWFMKNTDVVVEGIHYPSWDYSTRNAEED